jgi:hypothetical protein
MGEDGIDCCLKSTDITPQKLSSLNTQSKQSFA